MDRPPEQYLPPDDDAPSPPGGSDQGTYMAKEGSVVSLNFGTYCATGPHLAGHVQETGTGGLAGSSHRTPVVLDLSSR